MLRRGVAVRVPAAAAGGRGDTWQKMACVARACDRDDYPADLVAWTVADLAATRCRMPTSPLAQDDGPVRLSKESLRIYPWRCTARSSPFWNRPMPPT